MRTPTDWTPKHDLLYMYICLGHLPDRKLVSEEVQQITDKFKRWLPDVTSREFQKVRKTVMARYRDLATFQKRYNQYMKSAFMLRDFFHDKEEQLIALMNDLIGIAQADSEVSSEEIVLIKSAVKAWWLDLDPRDDGQIERLQKRIKVNGSKLHRSEGDEVWSKHHNLLYLFVCMGHLPDREFSFEEVAMIMRLWRRRFPQMSLEGFQDIRTVVMNRYNSYESASERYNQFLVSAIDLKETFKSQYKKLSGIFNDLYAIARSDQAVHENEITMLEVVAEIWDLNVEFAVDRRSKELQVTLQPNHAGEVRS